MNEITILHLSDIHFKKNKDEANRSFRQTVRDRLIDAVKKHSKENGNPDVVAITGDVAFSGKKPEYDEALEFMDKLKKVLPKGVEFLVVPGNHDVDRGQINKFFSLYTIIKEEKTDRFLESPSEIKSFINTKFKAYRDFIDRLNHGLYESKEDYFWVKNIKKKNVSFLGLNSAWACEGDKDPLQIALGFPQVTAALEKSKGFSNKILLLHHPLSDCFAPKDKSKWGGEVFDTCRLILHGHVHFDSALSISTPSASCICIGANAVYTHDGFIGFQFIRVRFDANRTAVRVWPYKLEERDIITFSSDTSRYKGQENKVYYDIETHRDKVEDGAVSLVPLEIPAEYRDWVSSLHSRMDTWQLDPNGKANNVPLPEIYIPIETSNPFYKPQKESLEDDEKQDEDRKEPQFIDIEKLLGRKECVLLQGPAGMGKTTLIKHIIYTITQGIGEASLCGYLPVPVFLKDIWPIYEKEQSAAGAGIAFKTLLDIYLDNSVVGLSPKVVENFCRRERAMFLFDGLDEVPAHLRSGLVEIIAVFRLKHKNNRFLLTGRPHGIDSKVRERFGDFLHVIEPLDNAKVKGFIKKWFSVVSGQAAGLAETTAGEMTGDIEANEYVKVFTENPLLLTAVCILYQDNKRLPDQRVDLYNRVVANLLYRRFHHMPAEKSSRVENYLKALAFHMQERNLKKIDIGEAKELLKTIFTHGDETLPEYNGKIDTLFEEIEPRCGLLKRTGEGEIEYFHLTFQEFLAARHMQYAEIDYKQYIEKPWWEETILLYTGLFDRDWKDKANRLVNEIITYSHQDDRCLRRLWLLGSKALRDIQGFKREETVVSLAKEKLISIIESKATLEERFEAGEILGVLGDPRIDTLNSPMVRVEAGEFIMGANDKEDREKPERRVYVDEFWMGMYSVTNAEFKVFIEDGAYSNKEFWTPEGWKCIRDEKRTEPVYWRDRKWNGPNFPVVGVSWYEAMAYTKWLSRKTGKPFGLPTEAQWEKAARGVEGFVYPWGDTFDKNLCNSWEGGLKRTSPVGIYSLGKSPYGCMDMSGNVWEWMENRYSEKEKRPALRGGSWYGNDVNLRCSARFCDLPDYCDYNIGFRVARSELF